MRSIILILIAVIIAIIVAVATGFLNINQVRGGAVPKVSASGNGVTAQGGQAPAFDVETGSIKVGTQDANVKLPTIKVERPDQAEPQAVTNNAM